MRHTLELAHLQQTTDCTPRHGVAKSKLAH
nr:MAG TPA: hypothetical protein [Caudoviricetes sp.]